MLLRRFGVGNFLVFLPDCQELYKQRGMLQRFFAKQNTPVFERVQRQAAAEMVRSLLRSRTTNEKFSALRKYVFDMDILDIGVDTVGIGSPSEPSGSWSTAFALALSTTN